jgi:hypothetical protein
MDWILVKVVGNTLENENGTVRSLNPSHNEPPYGPYNWQERPAGTAGGYERCAINGGVVVYNPSGHEPVPFAFLQSVPHSEGMSAIMEKPIKIETTPL